MGKKADMQKQVQDLLEKKGSEGTDQAAVVAEMQRLTAAAAAARSVNDGPLLLGLTDGTARTRADARTHRSRGPG